MLNSPPHGEITLRAALQASELTSRQPVREEANKAEGKLTAGQALRHRIRYFIDGADIGDATFVEWIFILKRAIFGEKRKSGARPIRGAAFGELKVLRDLRKAAIT